MRRLGRILLDAMTLLSLLLFAAIALFWVRSYWVQDELVWSRAQDRERWILASSRGQLAVSQHVIPAVVSFQDAAQAPMYVTRREPTYLPLRPLANRYQKVRGGVWAGVGFFVSEYTTALWWRSGEISRSRKWFVPHWLLAAIAVVMPARYAFRRTRRAPGTQCCVNCGYDLRATPDRCPECGTIPALFGQRRVWTGGDK